MHIHRISQIYSSLPSSKFVLVWECGKCIKESTHYPGDKQDFNVLGKGLCMCLYKSKFIKTTNIKI